ncbi:thioredoxin domain-containing protein [Pseudoclavibacter chungangensis]|uniref:Thioredoxin domain-containing protein n=1 Tax=Pseudoclavibacter chungangensis TaxID=587635 RepID=A0A7J5BYT6_9MICO|nr:thioredoxin domain-containing protein [Pseudoclavibacter chungangensis]KAB1659517.1 thioredoxin domain-containing protein [Pseudoclavibacter chungangensis]NYJ67620.1 protein-disulfide isomerase [Pseudoclavibacter chungangensis]
MAEKDRDHVRRLREEANAIRRQEQATKRRKRIFAQVGIIVGAVVVIALIVGGALWGQQLFFPAPQFAGAQATTTVTSTVTGEASEEPVVTGENGVVTIGQPTAPVTIDLYFDISCPHCIDYHAQVGPTFTDLIATGQAKVNYHAINYVAPYGAQAGGALLAIAAYDPANYLAAVDAFYSVPAETQQNWGAADYAALLPSIGVTNPEAVAAVQSGDYVRLITKATQLARDSEVSGTPSVAVNGAMQSDIPTAAQLYELVNANGGTVQAPAA